MAWRLKKQSYLVGCRQMETTGVCFGEVLLYWVQLDHFANNKLLSLWRALEATKNEFMAKVQG